MPAQRRDAIQDDSSLEWVQERINVQTAEVKKLQSEGDDAGSAERLLRIYRELLALLSARG